jgi:hypothetical protein
MALRQAVIMYIPCLTISRYEEPHVNSVPGMAVPWNTEEENEIK